jgi:hypothetical protein
MKLERLDVTGFVYGPKGDKNPRFVFIAIDDPVFDEIELSQAWDVPPKSYRGYFAFLDEWDPNIVLATPLKFKQQLKLQDDELAVAWLRPHDPPVFMYGLATVLSGAERPEGTCKKCEGVRDIPHTTAVNGAPVFGNARLRATKSQICLCPSPDEHLEIGGAGLRVVIEAQPKDIEIPIKVARILLAATKPGAIPGMIEFDLDLDDASLEALDCGLRYFGDSLQSCRFPVFCNLPFDGPGPRQPIKLTAHLNMLPTVPLPQQPPVLTFVSGNPVGSNFFRPSTLPASTGRARKLCYSFSSSVASSGADLAC